MDFLDFHDLHDSHMVVRRENELGVRVPPPPSVEPVVSRVHKTQMVEDLVSPGPPM